MRPIDADTLRENMQWSIDHGMYDKPYDYLAAIDDAPTIDAVQVVRCKDCKHLYKDGECPLRTWFTHTADDFCSYGERREDGK